MLKSFLAVAGIFKALRKPHGGLVAVGLLTWRHWVPSTSMPVSEAETARPLLNLRSCLSFFLVGSSTSVSVTETYQQLK